MSKLKRREPGERYGLIPLEVLQSRAWHWLPHFARSTVLALAATYFGLNNGALELTETIARGLGINPSERKAGLMLARKAGLVRETVPPRQTRGKGRPAQYALTWRPTNEFPTLNVWEAAATNDWVNFDSSLPPISSLRAAERFLGWRKSAAEEHAERHGLPRFLEGGWLATTERTQRECHAPLENDTRERHVLGNGDVARHSRTIRKKAAGGVT